MPYYTKTGGLLQNLFSSGNDEKTYHLLAKASNVEMTSGNVTVVHEETAAHKPVVVRNGIAPNPVGPGTGVAVVGSGTTQTQDDKKLIIFPLLVKPENDPHHKWNDHYWAASQRSNMATFNANRANGKRRHAARDLYTNPLETVVAIADGKVLDIRAFYCETSQVTIRHQLKDRRTFIIRYGELDPASIKVKIGDIVTQKRELGKTGKLLSNGDPLMKLNGKVVYMIHFEYFSGSLGDDLIKRPLTNDSQPFMRRVDLIDSLTILQEGYRNTFGHSEIQKKGDRISIESLTVSEKCIEFIKGWEKYYQNLYNDQAGHCTIGYGTLVHYGNCEGSESLEFKNGISKERATELLKQELSGFETKLKGYLSVKLYQREYDALLTLLYNCGPGAVQPGSTINDKLQSSDYEGASEGFLLWNKVTVKGKKIVSSGLNKRRVSEKNIYDSEIYDSTH